MVAILSRERWDIIGIITIAQDDILMVLIADADEQRPGSSHGDASSRDGCGDAPSGRQHAGR